MWVSCSKTWPARAAPRSSPSISSSWPWLLTRTLNVSSTNRRFSSLVPKSVSRPRSGTDTRIIQGSDVELSTPPPATPLTPERQQPQLPDLLVADGSRRAGHEVGPARGLGEGDH